MESNQALVAGVISTHHSNITELDFQNLHMSALHTCLKPSLGYICLPQLGFWLTLSWGNLCYWTQLNSLLTASCDPSDLVIQVSIFIWCDLCVKCSTISIMVFEGKLGEVERQRGVGLQTKAEEAKAFSEQLFNWTDPGCHHHLLNYRHPCEGLSINQAHVIKYFILVYSYNGTFWIQEMQYIWDDPWRFWFDCKSKVFYKKW